MRMRFSIVAVVLAALVFAPWGRSQTETPPGISQAPADAVPDTALQRGTLSVIRESSQDKLSVTLPAPYWEYKSRSDLLGEQPSGGGCKPSGPQISEDVVFFLYHKDFGPQANILCLQSPRTFLMRNEDDMESFVERRVDAVRMMLGPQARLVERGFISEGAGNPIVHRAEFRISADSPASAGGCSPPAAQNAAVPASGGVVLVVDRFAKPRGGEIQRTEFRVSVSEDVYDELKPEIESILDSVEHTGELAAEFYDPDAPMERLPDAETIEEGTKSKGRPGWIYPVFIVSLAWMLFRRKKPKQTQGA